MRKGLTLVEGLVAAGVILLVGGLVIFAALDTTRLSRDTARLSDVRQAQAALERSRNATASYPASLDGLEGLEASAASLKYAPLPQGCGPDLETTCRSYAISFTLEGQIGALRGGACQAAPEGITCASPK